MPTEQAAEKGYFNLWQQAAIRPARISHAKVQALRVSGAKPELQLIERESGGVPWEFIGLVWLRESDMNPKGTLCNGELIIGTGKRTRLVPKDRGPYATFKQSALDELKFRKLDQVERWSLERTCFEWESLNGWGYLGKCNSPYLYSWTVCYGPPEAAGGKYIADRVFSKTAIDTQQPGCVAILKALMEIDPSTKARFNDREPSPPKAVIDKKRKEITSTHRKVATGAGSAGTLSGASEATKQTTGQEYIPSSVSYSVMGVGFVVAVVAIVLAIRRGKLLAARW